MIYFQGNKISGKDSTKNYTPVLRTDDLISITVMGLDAEAVKPFNLSTYGNYNSNNINSSSGTSILSYLIDASGNIDFPVLGKIKMAGLNRIEATDLIKNKLGDFIKNPIVNIHLLNFKITILGDVSRPGTYSIPNERITLIEAIGMAGDLNLTGLRKNILVIRDIEGKKSEFRIDLTTKDVFNSEIYYLQQNDVVYVEPNRTKKNTSALNPTSVTLILSSITFLITIINLLKK